MSKVKHRVGIEGSLDSIYECLTTCDGLSEWWATSALGVAELNGTIELEFSELAVLGFEYNNLIFNETVGLTCVSGPGPWQSSELVFELNQTEEQVFVTLTHQNERSSEEDFMYFSTKWPVYLLSLKAHIETGEGRPYPRDIKIHVGD